MKLLRNKNSNRFCGPTALALLTDRHVDDAAHALRIASGKAAVKGVLNRHMLAAIDLVGHKALPVPLGEEYRKYAHNPTLAQALRTILRGANKDTRFLVNITGHYIVIQGRKLWDNKNPDGIFLGDCGYRRRRVRAIWAIQPSGTQAQPWTPPPAAMTASRFRQAVEKLGLSFDGSIVDAPTGFLFAGSGIHCRAVVQPFEEALAEIQDILPLVPCIDPDCDMCQPQGEVG